MIPSSPFNLMMILSTLGIQPGGKGRNSGCVNVCVRTIFEYYLVVVVVNDNITERLFQMSKVSNHSERTQGVLQLIFLFNKLKRQTSFVYIILSVSGSTVSQQIKRLLVQICQKVNSLNVIYLPLCISVVFACLVQMVKVRQ